MKKLLFVSLALLALLCAAVLCGCQKPQEEPAEPVVYWNVDRGIERSAQADGSYAVRFLLKGEPVTLQVPNAELMGFIDRENAIGLVVEGSKVSAAVSLADLSQFYLTLNYYVQSISKNTIKLNSSAGLNGIELVIKLSDTTPILDVSAFAATKGTPTTLQKGDGVTVTANADGSVSDVYVTIRQGINTTMQRYCPICSKDVEFTNWFSNASMPNIPGHYYIEKDIELTSGTKASAAGEITLDLNGKTVTMVKEGQRFYTLGENVTLNVMDTAGNGKAVVANGGNGPQDRGMFVQQAGATSVFNMYSGTIDASACIAACGCIVDNLNGVFNMYGGTFLGGTTTGVGGGAIIVQSEVNIYGGEIIGGNCSDLEGVKSNPAGGGCIRHNGTDKILNIYGGVIKGGTTAYRGGCIYANGLTNIYGGTITGGSAKEGGGGIYASGAVITISGDVNITGNEDGNLYLFRGKTITIGEKGLGNAIIDITMQTPGTFTSNAVPSDKISCFTTSQGDIAANADGTLKLK